MTTLPLDQVMQGDCIELLAALPERSVDCIFADPPYNLQLRQELRRPNHSLVDGVTAGWDSFADFAAYDDFTRAWLAGCQRVLKDTGTIWTIGTYHNIFRVGALLQDLGFWVLNDITWLKTNPMPNFRGVRFQNATETLIWAKKSATQKSYTFNYHAMKSLNDDKQMPNVWQIPLCTGSERLKQDGRKAHPTQKPEALLYRVIMASTNPGDVILDPFFGTGTTGAVARHLGRRFIGIEREAHYAELARARIAAVAPQNDKLLHSPSRRTGGRVSIGQLIESGLVHIGQRLMSQDRRVQALVKADGQLSADGASGSIHRLAAEAQGTPTANGWEYWYYEDEQGALKSLDLMREQYRHVSSQPLPSDDNE